jgi:hypothetical protein
MSKPLKESDAFKARCWEWAKEYFAATSRSHLIGLAERTVEIEIEETNKSK